jgi:phosphate/sulfate permease
LLLIVSQTCELQRDNRIGSFWFLILILVSSVIFDFANDWTDACHPIATAVFTQVLSPKTAVLMAVFLNSVGAFYLTQQWQSRL